jgi:filamentous hemagglutinin family protein
MNSKRKTVFKRNRLTAAVMSALLTGQSLAGPIGGQVVGGSGSISQAGATTTINQSTQNMAINWQSYNVNVGERVQYIQPNSSSISLNRILSNNGSTIAGRIDANGQVILVNPNGVFFTPSSVVNVGGIIASGLDIAPTDFMNSNYIFNEVLGTDGKVINSGTINASLGGNVAFIGKQVENDGLIVANLGTVNLAAGKQAVLTFDNGGLLGVRISKEILQDELGVDPAVMNSGEIHAEGGRVLLTASTSQDVFSQAVNTAGLDRATSVVVHEDGSFTLGDGADVVNSGRIDTSTASSDQGMGRIVLLGENVTSSGELRADAASGNAGEIEMQAQDTTLLTHDSITSAHSGNGGTGGTVKVLGDKVGLFDVSMVDASGANGGGQVLIGGDYQGSNPAVRNASRTLVARDASIYVDALEYGDGGKIVSWSDDSTWFYGSAYSRGGAVEGNGGLIEISGKGLSFNGQVDTSAVRGSIGTVLFDPTNIVVINGMGGTNDASLPDLSGAPAGDFEISENALESLLDNASIILQSTNDITIENLTDNVLDLGITTGSIRFIADSGGDGVGAFVMNDVSDTIRTQGGSINITGAEVTTGYLATTGTNIAGGEVSITSTGGISIAGIDTHGGAVAGDTAGRSGGDVNLTAVTGIAVGSINTSASDTSGSPNVKAGNAGAITIMASGGTADVTLSGALTANGGNGPTSGYGNDGSGGDGGAISISAGQDIILSSSVTISSNGGNGPTVGGDADGDGGNGGGVELDAGRDIDVNAAVSSNGGNATTSDSADGDGGNAGAIGIIAGNNLTIDYAVSAEGGRGADDGGAGGAITLEATAGYLVMNSQISSNGGDGGGGSNDDGGNAGDVTLLAGNYLSIYSSISAVGGSASGNDGGAGGDISIESTAGTVVVGNDVSSNGGNGGAYGSDLGGDAGAITITVSDSVGVGASMTARGGTGSISGTNNAITFNGNASDNTFTFNDNITLAGSMVTVNGGGGNDLLARGGNIANTWTISGGNSGILAFGNIPGTTTITFNAIENLTGGTGQDQFTLEGSGNITGLIDGGSGADSLMITAAGNRTIELGNRVNTNLNVYQVETVTANAAARNELLGDSDASVNDWTLTGPRNGMVFDGAVTTNFSNIDDATGTLNTDNFALAGDFAGLIDGGNGSDSLAIVVGGDRTVELGNRISGNLNVHQVETIVAYAGATNTLIGDSDPTTNDWVINTNRGGTVDNDSLTTTFSYFDTISGGDSVDVFTVGVSGRVTNLNGGAGNDTFYISGTVGNALDAGDDIDAVHMYATGRVGAIQLSDGNDLFYMSGGTIGGDVDGGAGNDRFVINAGAITGAVYGGDDNDDISIGAAVASLHVNGGDGVDTLGTSRSGFELTLSDTALVVGFSATQIESISAVDGILNARNGTTNTWDIAGTNSGSVNATSFSGFATLNGGDDADIFNVSGNGSITGLITGRGGDDSLNIDLAGRTQSGGRINYDGGGQAGDSITITGTAVGFSETYRTNQTVAGLPGSFDQLGYTSASAGLDVNYRAVGRVDDNVVVANLLLENSNAADSILLGNNTFEIENSIRVGVNYALGSKIDITVTTPSGGTVQLVDNVSLPGTLMVTTGNLLNPDAHTINAGALVLQNARADDLLITDVGSLHVVNSGPVYIQEQDDLTLAGLDTTDLLNITAGGNIDSSAILISSAALNLVAGGNENIYLDGQTHQLSGPLTLAAGNNIRLDNGGLTTLATVSAQNLTLDAGGNIIGDGQVTVGGTTTLTSTGDVNLVNPANDFDIIDINAVGKVTLYDPNNIAGGSLTAGSVELTSVAGVGGGPTARLHTNTADLTINNTNGGVYVQNGRDLLVSITNRGDIDLSNNGTVIIDRLYANGTDYSTGQTYAGDVRLTTQNYPVFAKTGDGSHSHTSAPDIVGQNLYVETQASDLGSLGRYMSIRANDNFTFVGARGYVFYYGAPPETVYGTPDLVVFSGVMGLSGQQLIGVESLGDVDEAVFTDVRNYYHEDVAIMLPAHQRMTDDDDEEERRRREAVDSGGG